MNHTEILADIDVLISNLDILEQSIEAAFRDTMYAITIITEGHESYLRIDFGNNYIYTFGFLNRRVDWRFLDARNGRQQELIVDLVDAWVKDVFNDGRRRRACKWFVETIEQELIAYVFNPDRISFDMLLMCPHAKN